MKSGQEDALDAEGGGVGEEGFVEVAGGEGTGEDGLLIMAL